MFNNKRIKQLEKEILTLKGDLLIGLHATELKLDNMIAQLEELKKFRPILNHNNNTNHTNNNNHLPGKKK